MNATQTMEIVKIDPLPVLWNVENDKAVATSTVETLVNCKMKRNHKTLLQTNELDLKSTNELDL